MTTHAAADRSRPTIIQGGMGVGVSSWELAGTVARTGHLGVVSGTALETVYARRLQLGDEGGHIRRAFAHFPIPEMTEEILERYFVPGGIGEHPVFRGVPMYTINPPQALQALSVVANFAEVFLAREHGLGGPIGINYLYKIQMPLLASIYGAMLAGVDFVIIGAGNPREVPAVLDQFARGEDGSLPVRVLYARPDDNFELRFSPRELMGDTVPTLSRPQFLAIVASNDLAAALAAEPVPPDGFVVERHVAGGHNAPPRGPLCLDDDGQPIYGDADEVDPARMVGLGLPFWLAGSYGVPGGLARALEVGATGIQVGTAFALCRESGMSAPLKDALLRLAREGRLQVKTHPRASPTGFPFKVVQLSGTLSDSAVYDDRKRLCDAGALRNPFRTAAGGIGYRCPAENETVFAKKRGRPQVAQDRVCLCNGLLATIGLGSRRRTGFEEPPVITLGANVESIAQFILPGETSYSATDVIARL